MVYNEIRIKMGAGRALNVHYPGMSTPVKCPLASGHLCVLDI
jgi:hypothetical protein